jgi:ketosteroid isomerase-like protein
VARASAPESRILRRRVLECYRAWSLLDIEKLAPFYSKAPGVVIFNDVEPVKFESWNEFRDAEAEIMARMSHRNVKPKALTVSVWGNMALSTSTPVLTAESSAGEQYSMVLRRTAIWEKRGRSWLIVHEHWSIPWPSAKNSKTSDSWPVPATKPSQESARARLRRAEASS